MKNAILIGSPEYSVFPIPTSSGGRLYDWYVVDTYVIDDVCDFSNDGIYEIRKKIIDNSVSKHDNQVDAEWASIYQAREDLEKLGLDTF